MFGIGSTELLVILVVALIVLGPKSLASVSRSLGKAMGEFRRVSTDFQRTLNAESAEAELREKATEQRRKAAADTETEATPPATTTPTEAPAIVAEEANSLIPPEGSPLAEALAKARDQAETAASSMADATTAQADSDGEPVPATDTPATFPIPPVDGPRA